MPPPSTAGSGPRELRGDTADWATPVSSEVSIPLTPAGTLIINADREAFHLVRLVLPNGDEYVRCHCNGIAEIRLTGRQTTIDHVAPGSYTMRLFGGDGKVKREVPVTIHEMKTTTVDVIVAPE